MYLSIRLFNIGYTSWMSTKYVKRDQHWNLASEINFTSCRSNITLYYTPIFKLNADCKNIIITQSTMDTSNSTNSWHVIYSGTKTSSGPNVWICFNYDAILLGYNKVGFLRFSRRREWVNAQRTVNSVILCISLDVKLSEALAIARAGYECLYIIRLVQKIQFCAKVSV